MKNSAIETVCGRPRSRRSLARTWRFWILGWVFLAFLGIQAIESTHHHESAADEDACPICQVMLHQAMDLATPSVAPLAVALFILFIVPQRRRLFRIAKFHSAAYHAQAPPSRSA